MRIVIVTLYNSINSGSYLQRQFKTYLESLGYDVFFLKTKQENYFRFIL